MSMKYSLLQLRWIFILLSSVLFSPVWTWGNTSVVSLKVQNVVKPLAVEDRHPVFSWQMSSDERGQKQSAYQIDVYKRQPPDLLRDSFSDREMVLFNEENIRLKNAFIQQADPAD